MANPKIDSIQFSGSTTKYDINLPTNATPSIAGLTVNGNVTIPVGSSTAMNTLYVNSIKANTLSYPEAFTIWGPGSTDTNPYYIDLSEDSYITLWSPQGITLQSSGDDITISSGTNVNIKTGAGNSIQLDASEILQLKSGTSEVEVIQGTNTISFPSKAGTVALTSDVDKKQDKLVSGTNIRTLNNDSLLGSGNLNTLTMTALYTSDTIQGAKFFGPSTYPTQHFTVLFDEFLINQNEVYNKRVPFNSSSSFKYPPTVIITPVLNDTTDTREVIWHLVSVDKNGFNFSVACKNTSMKVVSIHYIAIGEAN